MSTAAILAVVLIAVMLALAIAAVSFYVGQRSVTIGMEFERAAWEDAQKNDQVTINEVAPDYWAENPPELGIVNNPQVIPEGVTRFIPKTQWYVTKHAVHTNGCHHLNYLLSVGRAEPWIWPNNMAEARFQAQKEGLRACRTCNPFDEVEDKGVIIPQPQEKELETSTKEN